jgi:polyisoprenoid-binding protein YceI
MESDKFPKSSFQGKIIGLNQSSIELQHVRAVGKLTIHGVTRNVDIPGTIQIQGKTLALKSKFTVKLVDYNIKVPQIVWQNIAQEIEVSINFLYNTSPVIN